MASNIKVDIVRPTATNGSLSLKGDSGGSATTNGITVNSSGNTSITGQLNADNIRIDGNTISSTNTNGDILITPNGTGDVTVGTTPTINRISGASGNPLFGLVDKSIEVVGSTDTQNYRTGIAFGTANKVGSGIYANNIDVAGSGNDEDTNLEFYTTKEGLADARLAMTIDEDRNVTIVGSVIASDGAESTPSITNADDTNTGIYFPAADTVGVSTNGSERMRIDSNGNVRAAKFTDLAGTGAPDFPNGIAQTGLAASVFPAGGTGNPISLAIICDQKSSSTSGGDFTSGAWRTRDLNTEISDPDGIVSIASNQFTLASGTYLIEWSCPALAVDRHQSKLYSITNSIDLAAGTSEYTASTNLVQNRSFGSYIHTITSSHTYEIRHYCQTSKTSIGFGVNGSTGINNIYTIAKISKLK